MATSPIPIMGGPFQTTQPTSAPGVVNPLSTNPTGAQGGNTTGGGAPIIPGSGTATAKAVGGGSTGQPTIGTPGGTLGTLLGTVGQGGANPGTATGENGQTIVNGQQTQRQDDRTLGELQNYYGEGMGSYIYSLMQTGGINTNLINSVDSSMIAAMQPQINQGEVNLNSVLGAQGIGGNSSTAALANSNYQSTAATAENAQIAQTYLGQYDQGQQLLQSILGGVLGTNQQGTANQSNWMDYLNEGLQIAGTVAMI